jgi:integrase
MMATVGELFDRYSTVLFARVAPATARGYQSAWRQRVKASFAGVEIRTIRAFDVEMAFASWTGKYSTKIDGFALLSNLCKLAAKDGQLDANPCTGVDLPRKPEFDPASRALTQPEIDRLLLVLPRSGVYRRFVLAMLYTGCRLGEVAGLRVGDLDLADSVIAVRRTVSPGEGGRMTVGPTKGRRTRQVPIVGPLLPLIHEALEGKGDHDYLFPGPRGGHISSKNLSRALNWHEIRDGIKSFAPEEEPLHWHDLRHTAAVLFFRFGLSAPEVQAILGHSSLAVTQLYADMRKDAARHAAKAGTAYWAAQSRGQLGGGEETAESPSDQGI